MGEKKVYLILIKIKAFKDVFSMITRQASANNQDNKHNFNNSSYNRRKRNLVYRQKKLKELLDAESEAYEFEIEVKNKNNEKSENNKLDLDRNYNKFVSIKDNKVIDNEEKKINIPQSGRNRLENNNSFSSSLKNRKETPNKFINLESELDMSLRKYTENIDKLKFEDFMTRKQMQDNLLSNINVHMEKLKFGLNDKSYEEKAAQEWLHDYNDKFTKNYEHSNTSNKIIASNHPYTPYTPFPTNSFQKSKLNVNVNNSNFIY
jgi:hypothetical protein